MMVDEYSEDRNSIALSNSYRFTSQECFFCFFFSYIMCFVFNYGDKDRVQR